MRFPATGIVVIVDDNPDHAMIMRLVLARLAPTLTVITHASRAEFLDALRVTPRGALVLMDRRLGSAESFDLVTEVCRRRADLVTVMLSAALSPLDRARALGAGAVAAVEKPGSIDGWRSMLGVLLHGDEVARAA